MPAPGLWRRQRDTHHYSSHTGMFTQGRGLTEKTFQPQQLPFFKAETRQERRDITQAESEVKFTLIGELSLKLL